MNKNSPLYILLRLIPLFLLVFLLSMLYWSSLLIEEDLKAVKRELKEIREELSTPKRELPSLKPKMSSLKSSPSTATSKNNLLSEDPFYETTLPKLLGPSFQPHGTLRTEEIGKPENLHPFTGFYLANQWLELCLPTLANLKVGVYETFAPNLALSMELKEEEEGYADYWIEIRDDLFWQPVNPLHFPELQLDPHFFEKNPVTAHDIKFYFDAFMNPHVEEPGAMARRSAFTEAVGIKVIDDKRLVVRWKKKKFEGKEKVLYISKMLVGTLQPLPRFIYQYFADGSKIVEEDDDPETYRKNAIWAENFSHHWALQMIPSCGPWLFNGITDSEIRFKRNPDFYAPLAALTEEQEVKLRDSTETIWNDFKTGKVDFVNLPPHQLKELENFLESDAYQEQAKNNQAVKRLDYFMQRYAYVGWNQTRPYFQSKKVRQALTMAIDRERIIRQNLNGMGIQTTGTFSPFSKAYDKTIVPYPFDPRLAKQRLSEEGWVDSDGDGIIDKEINGQRLPFRFSLKYYVKNPTSKAVVEYIAMALKEIGIDCQLKGVDIADLSAIFDQKDFDAYYLEWVTGTPPENTRQVWHSEGVNLKGSSNAIAFSNQEIDRIIEALDYEDDPQKRISLYHRFDAIIHDEQPYTFLFVPKINFIYRERVQNVWIPSDRKDLIPQADVEEPLETLFWIKE